MKQAISMDNPHLDTPPVHETTGFHGQPHLAPSLIHETGHFHGQAHQKLNFVHENSHFHGQDVKIRCNSTQPIPTQWCQKDVGKMRDTAC